MNDLRTEIRSAFEKEQAAHSPAPTLRDDIVTAVVSRPHRAPSLQWPAVAAAVLIALLVVAGLMSTRLVRHASVPSAPKASPIADYGPPPAGVALIYVQDPKHPGWLIGFDWTGTPRGTVKLQTALDPLVVLGQSPDGSAFDHGFNGKGGNPVVLDRLGQPVAGVSQTHYQDVMWADDSRHMCTLDGAGHQWNLGLLSPGAAAFKTSVVAIDSANLRSGIIAVSFVGCSARNDQAVIQYSYMGRPSEYWVFRISDGKLLAHRTYAADQLVNFVTSTDGTLIAENSAKSTGRFAPAAPSTIIRRLADMSVVATLDPSAAVLGFNSDNSLALVATTPLAQGVANHLEMIEVRTGAVVWQLDGNSQLSSLLVQPDGRDFAVLLQDPRDSAPHPSVSIVIVHADGTAKTILGPYPHL